MGGGGGGGGGGFSHSRMLPQSLPILTLKEPSKVGADDTYYLSKKIRLDDSCQFPAKQRIHMKYQASLKNNVKDSRLSSAAVVIGTLTLQG